jgi:hypothetical protein
MSVGQPATLKLQLFGELIRRAFGDIPYHVGSSVVGKTWRDVDVRLILSDEDFVVRYGALEGTHGYNGAKWEVETMAFAALGKEITGLPIDFQVQAQTFANEKYPGIRSALFMHDHLSYAKEDGR